MFVAINFISMLTHQNERIVVFIRMNTDNESLRLVHTFDLSEELQCKSHKLIQTSDKANKL